MPWLKTGILDWLEPIGWLDRLGAWLYARTIRRAVRRGQIVGDFIIVPLGYEGQVMQKHSSPTSFNPLELANTISWKLIPKDHDARLDP